MKKLVAFLMLGIIVLVVSCEHSKIYQIEKYAWIQVEDRRNDSTEWELVWEDNFDQGILDSTKWSKIGLFTSKRFEKWNPQIKTERGFWQTIRNSWSSYMSATNEEVVQFSDSTLLLRGDINPDTMGFDNRPFHTGGIWTEKRLAFQYGRLEVRARLDPAFGAWPAIWMIPDSAIYPDQHNGEIDIMERLNHDTFVYQTIHSHWNLNLGLETPQRFTTAPILPKVFNTYTVSWYPDKIVFGVNGTETLKYEKIDGGGTFQWPFDQPFFILIDQQLEGWPGDVTQPEELPIDMEIDWVRLYQ